MDQTTETSATTAPHKKGIGLIGLIALVISSSIGSGVFALSTDISAAAVMALLDRKLIHHRRFLHFCIFANTQYRKSRRIANERSADAENSTKPTMLIIWGLLWKYFY